MTVDQINLVVKGFVPTNEDKSVMPTMEEMQLFNLTSGIPRQIINKK